MYACGVCAYVCVRDRNIEKWIGEQKSAERPRTPCEAALWDSLVMAVGVGRVDIQLRIRGGWIPGEVLA